MPAATIRARTPAASLALARVFRGQTKVVRIRVTDEDGVAESLTGSTLYFTVRDFPGAPAPVLSLQSGSGITHLNQAEFPGEADLVIEHGDTLALEPVPRSFDLWLKRADDSRHVLIEPTDFLVEAACTVIP